MRKKTCTSKRWNVKRLVPSADLFLYFSLTQQIVMHVSCCVFPFGCLLSRYWHRHQQPKRFLAFFFFSLCSLSLVFDVDRSYYWCHPVCCYLCVACSDCRWSTKIMSIFNYVNTSKDDVLDQYISEGKKDISNHLSNTQFSSCFSLPMEQSFSFFVWCFAKVNFRWR